MHNVMLETFRRWLHYRKLLRTNKPTRYRNLYRIVRQTKAKRIMEIGVFDACNSLEMINTAKIAHSGGDIDYFGFDLFEGASDQEAENEFSKEKRPLPMDVVRERLKATGANVRLFRGYTRETLPDFIDDATKNGIKMDFIFIDGGHRHSTIECDWNYCKELMHEKTVVVFDDYWSDLPEAVGEAGCQEIIHLLESDEKYDVKLLDPQNVFIKEWGRLKINFASVSLKRIL